MTKLRPFVAIPRSLREWTEWARRCLEGVIIQPPSYTVATLPPASEFPNGIVYVSNEAGGAVPAFSDGTNWRRMTDRAVVS